MSDVVASGEYRTSRPQSYETSWPSVRRMAARNRATTRAPTMRLLGAWRLSFYLSSVRMGCLLWAMRRFYFFRICLIYLGNALDINQMKLQKRPLAAGFLTGKLVNNEHSGTRADDCNPLGKAIQAKFASESLHTAMKLFDGAVKSQGLTPVEVAIRWITHHSALADGDAVILGASKTSQIKETVGFIQKGPLPPDLVMITDQMWEDIKDSRAGEP